MIHLSLLCGVFVGDTKFEISHSESPHNGVQNATAMKMEGRVTPVTGSHSGPKPRSQIKLSLLKKSLLSFEKLDQISLPFAAILSERDSCCLTKTQFSEFPSVDASSSSHHHR